MKHLGDITKINGAEIEPVDVITGGSPCQDLSVAGKRAGLAGARSGLFMEQIRIVKEMREHDRANGRTGDMVRPRFMVWENVPGAFSSNKGQDFAAVLEEIIRIAEPEAPDIEVPEKGWNTWGGYHIESAFSDDTSKAERIRELLKADKDGRVVVLPCKVGDTVYLLFCGNPNYPVISTRKRRRHWRR